MRRPGLHGWLARLRIPGAAALIILLLWGGLSWPLPRHVSTGIPSSARNLERFNYRAMIPGDHLQLLYHFWLAGEVLSGGIRPLTNPYEFNTGDATVQSIYDPHFIPFSLVYTALAAQGGAAFAWNMTGLLSLCLTFGFTYALARRYVAGVHYCFLAAIISIVFPFRWVSLMCGSPTGFAMAFIPMLLYGLDRAVRDRRPGGAVLAGLALFMANTTDMHVFYFSALAAPFWVLVALSASPEFRWDSPRHYGRLLLRLSPFALAAVLTLALSTALRGSYEDTGMAGGRTIREVALVSPRLFGLWSWKIHGLENQIFVGVALSALVVVALACAGVAGWRRRRAVRYTGVAVALLLVALLAIVCLALGVHGPADGLPVLLARKLIPKYTMIRQPMKIFCLAPVFIGLLVAVGLDMATPLLRRRWILPALAGALLLAVLAEIKIQIDPTVSLLKPTQAAYKAVADDARRRGREPHAVIITLWPGDSHLSSLYEYYVSLYRIRMVNGYSPVLAKGYVQNVYQKLESLNRGEISDAQLAALADMGVEYVMMHEDPYPERIARRPATQVLQTLLADPRLRLLAHDRTVWAFKILAPGETRGPLALRMEALSASWTFDWASRAPLEIGQSVRIPASTLFHSGYSDLKDGCLVLRRDTEPDRCVAYGRLIPLVQGTYEITTLFTSPAAAGTRLAYLSLEQDGNEVRGIHLFQGSISREELTVHQHYTPFLKLFFTREGDIRLNAFQIRRLR